MSGKKVIVFVGAYDASGAPDILPLAVECSAQDVENGNHYELAKNLAAEHGYEPQFAFDENDPAGRRLAKAATIPLGWAIERSDKDEILVRAPNGNGGFISNKGSLSNRLLYDLADGLAAATESESRESKSQQYLNFIRLEGKGITTVAVLQLESNYEAEPDTRDALKKSITEWVNTTHAGAQMWNYSSGDLNIGDLLGSDAFHDADLRRIMASNGLYYVGGMISTDAASARFDEVLVNEGDIRRVDQRDT